MRKRVDRSERMYKALIIAAVVIVLFFGGWRLLPWFQKKPPEAPPAVTRPAETRQTSVSAVPAEPRPVIRYDEDSEAFQDLMDRRKAEFGLEDGVDMIVRSDESLTIGENTISMKEILEKIQIEKGDVAESDADDPQGLRSRRERMDRLFEELQDAEGKYDFLEKKLGMASDAGGAEEGGDGGSEPAGPDLPTRGLPDALIPGTVSEDIETYAELAGLVEDFQLYKRMLREIDDYRKLLEADDRRAHMEERVAELRRKTLVIRKELARMLGMEVPEEGEVSDGELTAGLEEIQSRFRELDAFLKSPDAGVSAEIYQKKVRERAALRKIIAGYDVYQETLRKIESFERLLKTEDTVLEEEIRGILAALRIERDDLEDRFSDRLLPGQAPEVYGVYVVRRGDNIWNIHFEFLKEYFRHKNIILAPAADEPIQPGVSSGVGRVLKFSEKMVYIYNLRERSLAPDLNQIHPLSKIVIFNMGQAFDLLSQIDLKNINKIRFDGETLWIPAES